MLLYSFAQSYLIASSSFFIRYSGVTFGSFSLSIFISDVPGVDNPLVPPLLGLEASGYAAWEVPAMSLDESYADARLVVVL